MLTVDTNILIYAVDADAAEHGPAARELVTRLARTRAFLTQQVGGEFLNVCRRRGVPAEAAVGQLEAWAALFSVVPTRWANTLGAARLADRYKLQYWDCVIIAAAASVGGRVLFSQDMQDGFTIEGLRVVNPFAPANRFLIDALPEA